MTTQMMTMTKTLMGRSRMSLSGRSRRSVRRALHRLTAMLARTRTEITRVVVVIGGP